MAVSLTIELKKAKDGKPSLACVRADGSRTWAKLHPFFPTHDLTHCAVESVLGFDQAFYGLIASGWGIDDFAAAGAAKRLGAQALCAENIVGHVERGVARDAGALNAALAMNTELAGYAPCAAVTDAQLAAIRLLRSKLTRQWWELPEGETLRIGFPAT